MAKQVKREPHPCSKDEFLSTENGLPMRIEWVRGKIGPFNDAAPLTLVANRGADRVVAVIGAEVWRNALSARDTA